MSIVFLTLLLLTLSRSVQTSSEHNNQPSTERPTVVLTTTNVKLLSFTRNLLGSIEKTGAHPNVTILAEDVASFKALSADAGLRVIQIDAGMKPPSTVMPRHVLQYLKQGLEIFMVNSDAYWFQDPFPYFDGDFDFALTKDRPKVFNMGLAYFRPTKRTLTFVTQWVWRLEREKTSAQDVLNDMLKTRFIPDLKFKLLNSENFPNGGYFFPFFPNLSRCRKDTSTTIVFYAAYIKYENKAKAFETCKIWLKI